MIFYRGVPGLRRTNRNPDVREGQLCMSAAPVQRGYYKDQPSFVLENDILRAEFIAHGGRMVSLRHKPTGFEFLYQNRGAKYSGGEYDRPLKPEQAAGYDDMLPTIIECHYEDYPWKGTVLPDHGEAWSVDWNVAVESDGIRLWYYGVRLPYRLSRRVTFAGPGTLQMDYSLENLSGFSLSYIWSAHPMLAAPAGTHMEFPEECRRAIGVVSESGRLGAYGDEFEWPRHTDARGIEHDLSIIREPSAHDEEKYFFKSRLKNGWCRVHYPEVRLGLTLRFPAESIPYVAVVVGEGWMFDKDSVLLLEPCSAPFDRLDLSRNYTRDSKVGPKGTNRWFLTFLIEED